eukprot:1147929-Pelagomonas_calceolata.AAC.3
MVNLIIRDGCSAWLEVRSCIQAAVHECTQSAEHGLEGAQWMRTKKGLDPVEDPGCLARILTSGDHWSCLLWADACAPTKAPQLLIGVCLLCTGGDKCSIGGAVAVEENAAETKLRAEVETSAAEEELEAEDDACADMDAPQLMSVEADAAEAELEAEVDAQEAQEAAAAAAARATASYDGLGAGHAAWVGEGADGADSDSDDGDSVRQVRIIPSHRRNHMRNHLCWCAKDSATLAGTERGL